jgi:hypothetical protein
MAKNLDLEARYERDDKVAIHEFAALQLAQRIASHDAGIAEWVKNSCDAYSEADALPEHKVIIVFLHHADKENPALVGCLDFVGMTTEKIETRFNQWGDPEAAAGATGGKRKGGHGHGGKAYMVNMFKDYALILTCSGGYGNRYGFRSGNVTPGYFPDRTQGRRFPVTSKEKFLEQNIVRFSTRLKDLPDTAKFALEAGSGFTVVKGVDAKDLPRGRFPISSLIEDLQSHPQMIEVLQEAKVFVLVNGEPCEQAWPMKLPLIEPMDEAQEPKEFPVPTQLSDPSSGEKISTTEEDKSEVGKLILRTSKKSMMWNYRPRHKIYIHARGEHVGSWDVRDLSGKGFADQIYGDLILDSLLQYKTSDRLEPSPSLLTRAVREWVRRSIDEYCQIFVKLERLKATQKDRDEWQRISEQMNEWKNRFLQSVGIGLGQREGPGGVVRERTRLPRGQAGTIQVSISHEYSGIGVAIQPTIEFRDLAGQRIRSVPYRWNSSDWNVGTVDEDLFRVITHSPGETEVWAETLEGKIVSNRVKVTVLDIKNIKMKDETLEMTVGRFKALSAEVEVRSGAKYESVYLNWIADNIEVVRVGEAGVVWAIATGTTEVTAGDDRAQASPGTIVTVVEGVGSGKQKGRGFPQILLSGIDPDPFEPDKFPEQFLTRQHPPVYQRVAPDDVGQQIWWINMASPLASRYWLEASGQSVTSDKARQWRVYYLERFIEAMVKIRLYIDYKFEGNTNWDMLKERWDDVMIEMQEAMASELEPFLEGGLLPELARR